MNMYVCSDLYIELRNNSMTTTFVSGHLPKKNQLLLYYPLLDFVKNSQFPRTQDIHNVD